MIIWQRAGILGFIVPFGLSILADLGFEQFYYKNFYKQSQFAMPLVFVISSVIVFLLGRWLNSSPPKLLLDLESGKIIKQHNSHRMFWIKLEYWGLILFLIAFWIFFANIGLIYKSSFKICG